MRKGSNYRLYYKLLKGTVLEDYWKLPRLIKWLEANGYIKDLGDGTHQVLVKNFRRDDVINHIKEDQRIADNDPNDKITKVLLWFKK